VRTEKGLRELTADGDLVTCDGSFKPNYLRPLLNEDPGDKARVLDVVSGWLGTDEDAESLLTHIATCLSPHYTAVKYVLLLGEGRNGKSLLLKMINALFGSENVSNVTRLAISEKSPVVTGLNGKLVNIVYDGEATYLKDAGAEKTLIAGEPFPIRMLYESTPTMVQTNALFIEGLQREPKTGDKSTALQKRLVRFQFPNVYKQDHTFERLMLSEKMLGAFLSLLIDRYVREDEVAEKLALTEKSMEMQLEQMYTNSIGLQFLRHLEESDPLGAGSVVGMQMPQLCADFKSWRVRENDMTTWAEPDVAALFGPLLAQERKSVRIDGSVRKVRVVTALKEEATAFIQTLEGDEDHDAALLAAVVED